MIGLNFHISVDRAIGHPMGMGNYDDGDVKIGAPSHGRRNRWLVLGLGGAALAMGLYYVLLGRHDADEGAQLDRFRAAYAQKCDAPGFAEPTPPIVRELYLSSSVLQAAIGQQLVELERGADCDAVYKALRAADFPMPQHAPAPPTPAVTLQPHAGAAPADVAPATSTARAMVRQ